MRSRRAAWAALALSLLGPAFAAAQELPGRDEAYFLERSRIFNRFDRDDLAFEGHIAPHLFFRAPEVWGDTGDVFLEPRWSWSVSFTPLVRLRMMTTTSNPVRTPSYMPRPLMDWQIFRASVVDTGTQARRNAESRVRLWALTLTPWAHHSNGQDGCLFEHQTRDPDTGDCTGDFAGTGVPPVNRVDGSFSTNFIRAALGYARFRPEDSGFEIIGRDRCSVEIGVEYHPIEYLVGGLSEEQAAFYAQIQATAAVEWGGSAWDGRKLSSQWLIGGDVRWMDDPAPDVPSIAWGVEASLLPDLLHGWGGFVRYYSGMDYYNLGFVDEISYVQFGLVWDFGATPRFVMPSSNVNAPLPAYPRNRAFDGWLAAPFDLICELST